ncbi:11490_t:CDS:1, partial [Paraglomus brasilianum]
IDIVEKLVSFAEARSSNPTPNVVLDGIKERVEKYELNHQQLQQIIIQLRTEADIRMESVEARLDVQQSEIAETRLEVQQLR